MSWSDRKGWIYNKYKGLTFEQQTINTLCFLKICNYPRLTNLQTKALNVRNKLNNEGFSQFQL